MAIVSILELKLELEIYCRLDRVVRHGIVVMDGLAKTIESKKVRRSGREELSTRSFRRRGKVNWTAAASRQREIREENNSNIDEMRRKLENPKGD
jgi:hypothetical protein